MDAEKLLEALLGEVDIVGDHHERTELAWSDDTEARRLIAAYTREVQADAEAACRAIHAELHQRGELAGLFDEDWNPNAHIELTLTVAECRAAVRFIQSIKETPR